jgi:hypothetical protein
VNKARPRSSYRARTAGEVDTIPWYSHEPSEERVRCHHRCDQEGRHPAPLVAPAHPLVGALSGHDHAHQGPKQRPPPATPLQDRPRELAEVSAPSCPCSAPPVPGRPTTSRPTPTRSPPSPSPAPAYLCTHPTRPDPRATAAAEGVPNVAYYGEDTPAPFGDACGTGPRICGLPRIPLPRTSVNKLPVTARHLSGWHHGCCCPTAE